MAEKALMALKEDRLEDALELLPSISGRDRKAFLRRVYQEAPGYYLDLAQDWKLELNQEEAFTGLNSANEAIFERLWQEKNWRFPPKDPVSAEWAIGAFLRGNPLPLDFYVRHGQTDFMPCLAQHGHNEYCYELFVDLDQELNYDRAKSLAQTYDEDSAEVNPLAYHLLENHPDLDMTYPMMLWAAQGELDPIQKFHELDAHYDPELLLECAETYNDSQLLRFLQENWTEVPDPQDP